MRTRAIDGQSARATEITGTPGKFSGVVVRALSGSASPRQAIKARCLQCSNYQRLEIRNCTVLTCALWRYRPYQGQHGLAPFAEGERSAEMHSNALERKAIF